MLSKMRFGLEPTTFCFPPNRDATWLIALHLLIFNASASSHFSKYITVLDYFDTSFIFFNFDPLRI